MTSPEGFSFIETEVQAHTPEIVGQAALEATAVTEPEVIHVVYDLGDVDIEDEEDDSIETLDLTDIDAATTQGMLEFAGIEVSFEFCQKLAPIAGDHKRLMEIIEDTKYPLELLLDEPWLAKKGAPNDFPFDQPESMKIFWTANHSYEKLGDEWSKGSIGKIIRTRLKNEIDESLHDASQWLSAFKTPEKHHKFNPEKGKLEEVILHNCELEKELLWAVVKATDEERKRMILPKKESKINAMIHSPFNRFLYATLLSQIEKNEPFDSESLQRAVKEQAPDFAKKYNSSKGMSATLTEEHFIPIASGTLNMILDPDGLGLFDEPSETQSVPAMIKRLIQYSANKKEYVDDATSWLLRHMTSPSKRLAKVWGDRQMGLNEGIEDNAKSLEQWQKANAMRIYLDKIPDDAWQARYCMSKADVSGKYGHVTKELLRHYDAAMTIYAISRHWVTSWINEYRPAVLPPSVVPIEMNGVSYTAEVLAKDDPRGMTIGPDTGCCMTLYGTSRTCLQDGYDNQNAGFFALYNDKNKIMAQSYFYINPNHPDTVVLDNIEANAGRDVKRIIKLYQRAFARYLDERVANDPEWQIKKVQLGTGIGEQVKPHAQKLPKADIILHPKLEKVPIEELNAFNPDAHDFTMQGWNHIYSDAIRDQRVLLVHGQEITGDYQVFDSKTRPQQVSAIELVSVEDVPEEAIAEMEEMIYPSYFRTYNEISQLREDLSEIAASFFSLVIEASAADGTKDYRGYSIAYLTDSIIEPKGVDATLYVADVAIAPDLHGERYGAMLMREILERADAANIKNIEMHARESTMYKVLKTSATAKRVLKEFGYELIEPKVINETIVDLDGGVTDGRRLVALRKA